MTLTWNLTPSWPSPFILLLLSKPHQAHDFINHGVLSSVMLPIRKLDTLNLVVSRAYQKSHRRKESRPPQNIMGTPCQRPRLLQITGSPLCCVSAPDQSLMLSGSCGDWFNIHIHLDEKSHDVRRLTLLFLFCHLVYLPRYASSTRMDYCSTAAANCACASTQDSTCSPQVLLTLLHRYMFMKKIANSIPHHPDLSLLCLSARWW